MMTCHGLLSSPGVDNSAAAASLWSDFRAAPPHAMAAPAAMSTRNAVRSQSLVSSHEDATKAAGGGRRGRRALRRRHRHGLVRLPRTSALGGTRRE